MSMMYFTFGVLTVIAMIAIGVIIYSMVRIFKTEKQIKYIQDDYRNGIRNVQEDLNWRSNDFNDRFKDYHQRIENVYISAKDMSNAYTDMCIDKLEDKLTNSKKLLKG